jgi:secreted Zn-dependent insulinase-like peptidase
VFDEVNDLGKFSFEFADKGRPMNNCVSLAGRMQIFDTETMPQILRSRQVREEFDPELNKDIAERLADYKNCVVLLKSKSFEESSDKVAEWYETKYSIESFSDELIKKMTEPACEIKTKKLDLPPVNNLIPKNFDILPKDENLSKEPTCI